jgi:hypothetical protein
MLTTLLKLYNVNFYFDKQCLYYINDHVLIYYFLFTIFIISNIF